MCRLPLAPLAGSSISASPYMPPWPAAVGIGLYCGPRRPLFVPEWASTADSIMSCSGCLCCRPSAEMYGPVIEPGLPSSWSARPSIPTCCSSCSAANIAQRHSGCDGLACITPAFADASAGAAASAHKPWQVCTPRTAGQNASGAAHVTAREGLAHVLQSVKHRLMTCKRVWAHNQILAVRSVPRRHPHTEDFCPVGKAPPAVGVPRAAMP